MSSHTEESTTEFSAILLLLLWLDTEDSLSFIILHVLLDLRNKRVLNCQTKLHSKAFYWHFLV